MDSTEFGNHIGCMINSGIVCMSIALGREMGIFECMCSIEEPTTSHEIAAKLELKERYVQEWLGTMVAASIVEIDPITGKYHIPESHRQTLLNGTSFASLIPVLSHSHDEVKRCFRKDGPQGFQFSEQFFDFFHESWSGDIQNVIDKDILEHLPKICEKLENGCLVCDVGCGTGQCLIELSRRFPKSTFTGVDPSAIAIKKANESTKLAKMENIVFEQTDASKMSPDHTDKYDWIIISETLHDCSSPTAVLSEVMRVLKTDGTLSVIELQTHTKHSDNKGKLFSGAVYSASTYTCLPSALSNGPSAGLGAAVGVEAIAKMLNESGFKVNATHCFMQRLGLIMFECSKK